MKKIKYDNCIIATGKAGIDFSSNLIKEYNLPTEGKSCQIGVRYEAPMKYFQKLIDISYDFKLYQKPTDKISLRSFCTNNEAAYVAVEETYGDISYNGHALKDLKYKNNMTNFGILMEIKGVEDPFEWARKLVNKIQTNTKEIDNTTGETLRDYKAGIYYSPNNTRLADNTSEGTRIKCFQTDSLKSFKEIYGEYAIYILNFIEDLNKVFNIGNDWGIYIPEVKYVSPEPIVNYNNLSLTMYPNVYFAGDALSARGITVSGAQGIYISQYLLESVKSNKNIDEIVGNPV